MVEVYSWFLVRDAPLVLRGVARDEVCILCWHGSGDVTWCSKVCM